MKLNDKPECRSLHGVKLKLGLKWWFTCLYWPMVSRFLYICKLFNDDIELKWSRCGYWLNKALTIKVTKG